MDFRRLYKLQQTGAFLMTRAKRRSGRPRAMDARRVYSAPTDRSTGVISDQMIAMNGFYVARDYPERLWL